MRHGTCVSAPTCRLVKRILRKHGYPSDKQEAATKPCLSRPRHCRPPGQPDGAMVQLGEAVWTERRERASAKADEPEPAVAGDRDESRGGEEPGTV